MPIAHPESRTYRAAAFVLRPLLFAITKRDWQGGEHLRQDGGFIVAANHFSNLDPLTFAHFMYDHGIAPRILAKSSLFTIPVVGKLLANTGQIPVHRQTTQAGRSLEEAVAALEGGACVAVFPEGTLTREPNLWPMAGKTGVARLALLSRAPVVPVVQWGVQEILPRYSKKFRPFPRKTVHVHAGPPVDLSDLYDRPLDTVVLREATERVMTAITTILEGIRGEQAPAERYVMRDRSRPSATPEDPA